MTPELQGFIFDLDGTLVDSRLDFPAMRRETGCPEGTGLLEHIDGLADASERERAAAIVHRHEMDCAAGASWMPGAHAILRTLSAKRVPMGIVTRNSRQATELTLSSLGAPPIDLVTREDAPPKPDPAGLLQLAARWGLDPLRLAYVGDFRYDLQAATAAGMCAILYHQPRNRDYAAAADQVIHHFAELLAWLPERTSTG